MRRSRDHLASLLRRADPAEVALAAECEAFLAGSFVEHARRGAQPVPAWSWTNALAHAEQSDLERISGAAEAPGPMIGAEAWWSARAYLAGEVLAVAARRGPLRRIQVGALQPLELDLAARPAHRWYPPADWVRDVLARLEPFDSWRPRRATA